MTAQGLRGIFPKFRRALSSSPAHAFAIVILLAASIPSARAEGPAVSALNGKVSAEGGMTGIDGYSSGVGTAKGSIAAPLGDNFGVQLDALAGTAFNTGFGGGTAHLFWRDPEIGLFGPVVSMAGGGGVRLGWYGAEAEIYAKRLTVAAWGGYHDAVNSVVGRAASTGYYGGSVTAYPTLNLALTVGATSEFNRLIGNSTIEFQPDLFARRNLSFFVDGEVANHATYSVTAGIRFYFGADKPLIRRHREDDPMTSGRPSVLADLLEPTLRVIVETGYDRGRPQAPPPPPSPFGFQPPGPFVLP
jgi:hypothetical protein